MEHARKFLLVSADGASRFGKTQSVSQEQSHGVMKKMSNILDRTDIPDDRKLALYNQQQYQYFNHRNAMNQPVKISIHDRDDEKEESSLQNRGKPRNILRAAVDFFQKLYRENAIGLGNFLLDRVDNVQWN